MCRSLRVLNRLLRGGNETDRICPVFIKLLMVPRTCVFVGGKSAQSISIIHTDRRRQGSTRIDGDAGLNFDLKLDWADPEAISIT